MPSPIVEIHEASNYIREAWPELLKLQPKIAIVLGSGLTSCLEHLVGGPFQALPFHHIPHFAASTVMGHKGELLLSVLNERCPIMVMSGRLHYYEGLSAHQVILPLRVLRLLGLTTVILTNASGAIGDNFEPGDFMVVRDHLNLTGHSPLVGKNLDELGPRFVDMSKAYDEDLIKCAKNAARQFDATMHEGVYAGMLGPCYETPAETRMLKNLGADAAGMSTVFEVIAARHMNMRVLAISCLTNKAAGLSRGVISHQEVMENNALAAQKLGLILKKIVMDIDEEL
jgi:purine-nucleoside phosphorylase